MLRNQQGKSFGSGADLSAESKTALRVLLWFISDNIKGFRNYYFNTKDKPKGEEAINTYFVRYFTSRQLEEKDGYLSFSFEKHPATEDDSNEPDFGVSVANSSKPESIIFEIEAKRLDGNSSYNHQYVYGQNRGAIERFKQHRHGRNIEECGIVGYVQTDNCKYWLDKINEWVEGRINSPNDNQLLWENCDKPQVGVLEMEGNYMYCTSSSSRLSFGYLKIHHYLIKLF